MTAILYLIIVITIITIILLVHRCYRLKYANHAIIQALKLKEAINNNLNEHWRDKYLDKTKTLNRIIDQYGLATYRVHELKTELTQSNLERDLLAAKALELFNLNNDTEDELQIAQNMHEADCATSRVFMCDFRKLKLENDLLADKALELWFNNRVYHDQLNKALNRTDASIGLNAIDYFNKHLQS